MLLLLCYQQDCPRLWAESSPPGFDNVTSLVVMVTEGRSVYLSCDVSANPMVDQISWTKDDVIIAMTSLSSQNSYVIVDVTRSESGLYGCLATNTLVQSGEQPVLATGSAYITLDVQCE